MKKIIDGQRIHKSFTAEKESIKVLRDVSVTIYEGEFIAVMGPSGSGKSTLLYTLSGMDTVDSGKVAFIHHNLTECGEAELADIRRQQMGFVFQQPAFLKNLTIIDNIILPSMRDNRKQVKALTNKAQQLLERTGIGDLADRMTHQVSGGQLQRAGICRALINEPKIIFGDEPTGALNSKSAQEIMDQFLQTNQEGTTIMLVTHDAKVAAQSERVLFMKDGQIVDELQLGKLSNQAIENRTERVTKKMLQVEM
ncbi:ABC transporter ATP-binding protein [Gracilibacillus alcaliphilus]|uniref:ABC transporter ATP-binding protein n=1 Tax=Gracilibacillus alcaliphilus TaxID=1401441 RepID=UPI00195A2A86|nr:ABC transporter ATP-binding protein [Gracilibacillus alcaliphilus]MBM7675838.1 putative ABC transport system ATP-binding protein [Gracilibacillus alcaliphilus]